MVRFENSYNSNKTNNNRNSKNLSNKNKTSMYTEDSLDSIVDRNHQSEKINDASENVVVKTKKDMNRKRNLYTYIHSNNGYKNRWDFKDVSEINLSNLPHSTTNNLDLENNSSNGMSEGIYNNDYSFAQNEGIAHKNMVLSYDISQKDGINTMFGYSHDNINSSLETSPIYAADSDFTEIGSENLNSYSNSPNDKNKDRSQQSMKVENINEKMHTHYKSDSSEDENVVVIESIIYEEGSSKIYKVLDRNNKITYALKELQSKTDNIFIEKNPVLHRHMNIRKYYLIGPESLIGNFNSIRKQLNMKYKYLISDYCEMTLRDFIVRRNSILLGNEKYKKNDENVSKSLIFCNGEIQTNRCYIKKIFIGIVKAVRYFHVNGFIHRDVKPENIFFENLKSNTPLLGDFDLAREYNMNNVFSNYNNECNGGIVNENSKNIHIVSELNVNSKKHGYDRPLSTEIGTIAYCAPEVCNCYYTPNIDVYSLGLIYFELLRPFETNMERDMIFTEIKSSGKLPDCFKNEFEEETNVIESCLALSPFKRFSSRKVLQSLLGDKKNSQISSSHSYDDEVYAI